MIDLAAARAGIGAALRTVDGLHVYERAVDGPIELPAAVLGLVETDWDTGPCTTDTTAIPVAVAVAHDGMNEAATQEQLETLWVLAAEAMRSHLEVSPLADVGVARTMPRSMPGSLDVAGQSHPAYVTTIEIHG